MLLGKDARSAVYRDGLAEPDVDPVFYRDLIQLLRIVVKIRRPSLHTESYKALRQYAADPPPLRVLEEHDATPLITVNDRIHAAREELEYFLYIAL